MVNKKVIGGLAIGGLALLLLSSPKQEEQTLQGGGGGGGFFGLPFSAGGTSDPSAPSVFNLDFGEPNFDQESGILSANTSSSGLSQEFNAFGDTAVFDSSGQGVLVDANNNPIGSTSRDIFNPVGSGRGSGRSSGGSSRAGKSSSGGSSAGKSSGGSSVPRNTNSISNFVKLPKRKTILDFKPKPVGSRIGGGFIFG